MKKLYAGIVLCFLCAQLAFGQSLPSGGQWGCPAIPLQTTFDTTCFQRTGQILLGQGFVDIYGGADPLYLVIPQNKPHYALSMAIGWNYFRNIVGNNSLSINQFMATMAQENGFATYFSNNATADRMPANILDAAANTTVALPCMFNRGCNNYNGGGGSYYNAVANNITPPDGPYQFSLAGYQTANPYVPARFPAPESTYHSLYSLNMPTATMSKVFYDLSTYRKAQLVNNFDIGALEGNAVDKYGVDGALAVVYNLGPNSGPSIASNGYVLSSTFTTNSFNSNTLFAGGVSNYAQRVACVTALLDSNKTYAVNNCGATYGGNASNWKFYSYYDQLIPWDTVKFTIQKLFLMYPTINQTTFLATIKAKFDAVKGGAALSFRYEFGPVLDEIILNLPKDDPGATAANAINSPGCKLGCTAPYTRIVPTGPTTICVGQNVVMNADVDGATSSTTYQWFRNGTSISGANTMTFVATLTGTYSVVACWNAINITNGSTVKCCSTPECKVDVTVLTSCSSCAMGLTLTQTQNACTGMPNGGITAVASGSGATGNLVFTWSGPSSGSTTLSGTSFFIPGLRDGKYTVSVRQALTPSCRAVQDIFVTPVTALQQTVNAVSTVGSCNTQLNAIIVNQQPTTCQIQVSYGAIGGYSWDASFYMSLRNNAGGLVNMFQGYTLPYSSTNPSNPWDAWPFSYPAGGTGNAPNVAQVTVRDGDTLTAEGIVIVPLGTAVPGFLNGAIKLENGTFTNLTTGTTSSAQLWNYKGPAPAPGLRQIGDKVRVTCPVVSPPSFTYAWGPSTGLNNPNIQNPVSSHNVNPYILYTVTATLVANTNCKLTDTIYVNKNCLILPISFRSFDVKKEDQADVLLWEISENVTNGSFSVEYSLDGTSFEQLTKLQGKEIKQKSVFEFKNHVLAPKVFYRIAFEDADGKITYSYTKMIERTIPWKAIVVPNPFEGESLLKFTGMEKDWTVELKIFDALGNLVFEKSVSWNGESYTVGKDLVSGVYWVNIQVNGHYQTLAFIKK